MNQYESLVGSIKNLHKVLETEAPKVEPPVRKLMESVCAVLVVMLEEADGKPISEDLDLMMRLNNQRTTIREMQKLMLDHFLECGATCDDELISESLAIAREKLRVAGES